MADKQTYANIKRMKEENEECMKMLRENDEEIKNLKKEVKSLRCSEVSVEDHQKVCDFLNNEAEEYKKKYQEAREENEKLRHQGLRLMKRLEEYDYQFDWTDEKRKLNDENEKLKEDNKYLNNRYKNAIKIIDATEAYDIDLDCDNEVDDYLEGLL
tara:strand:- start:33 stop:500 length:468 start_codon:yes stop_codon:yes gene_type:complete